MDTQVESRGFGNTGRAEARTGHSAHALAGLIATGALAFGTIVAATVITMGIARADGLTTVLNNEGGVFAIALLLGLLFIASCFTKAVSPQRNEKRDAARAGLGRERFPVR